MPIAVVIYDRELDTWAPGAHTATFRGNQLAFAAGVALGEDHPARRHPRERAT